MLINNLWTQASLQAGSYEGDHGQVRKVGGLFMHHPHSNVHCRHSAGHTNHPHIQCHITIIFTSTFPMTV